MIIVYRERKARLTPIEPPPMTSGLNGNERRFRRLKLAVNLKKSLFGKENVTNDELVRMVLQLKSGRWMQEMGGRTMKTPDEIKKALKCHRDGRACHDCPYEQGRTFSVDGVTFGCSKDIVADALAYIEQLESRVKTDKE